MVEEILMSILQTISNLGYEIVAVSGLILFSLTAYYNYKVRENFKENEEYATAKFFIDRRASRSFWILTTSALIFPFGIILGMIGTRQTDPVLSILGVLSSIALMISLAYFHLNIYLITKSANEKE